MTPTPPLFRLTYETYLNHISPNIRLEYGTELIHMHPNRNNQCLVVCIRWYRG